MAGRLLLVGELNDDLTELKMTFEALGLAVEQAADGLAGVEKGLEFQPDLVVTEILTNRISGFELASRIGSGAAGFAAPVIFYTEFYRDEKARRDVLAKYGAAHYFVRPFQKEALKKAVAAHFQDYVSSLPATTALPGTPHREGKDQESSSVVPKLSRAAAAAEKPAVNSIPGRAVLPNKATGSTAIAPEDSRSAPAPVSELPKEVVKPEIAGSAVGPSGQPGKAAAKAPSARATVASRPEELKPRGPSLLPPVQEPSWFGRVMRSIPFRIAALLAVVALVLFLGRDLFREGGESEVAPAAQVAPPAQVTAEPVAESAAQPSSALPQPDAARTAPLQEPDVEARPVARTEPAKSSSHSPPDEGSSAGSLIRDESTSSRQVARERSPGLSIQDVTGAGRGPALRRMTPIQLSRETLSAMRARPVVVRVVIDGAGKVTEVTPLNQDGTAVSLPPDALAAIQQWEFTRSRRKDGGTAVKYFSLKAQISRR
jgi:CheY-like chemotaxis protein